MYWPRVLIIPLGPAPYRKMLTVPGARSGCWSEEGRIEGEREFCRRTVDEADDDTDGC